jgi:hypothetical protein
MKKDLLNKLKNYSKTAAAMAVVGGTANAQIVYTDIDADTTLNTFPSEYEIDFDGDGNIDLNINMQSSGTSSFGYFKINARVGSSGTYILSSSGYIAKLNTSFLIGNSSTSSSIYFAHHSGSDIKMVEYRSYIGSAYGNWASTDVDNKFVGVKFDISGNTHYGWIRLSTHVVDKTDMYATIKDFAYQSIPDSAIYAGAFDSLQIDLGNDAVVCYDDSLQLTAPNGYTAYEWSTLQIDTNSIYVNASGQYSVTVHNGPEGPVGIDTINIISNPEIITQLYDYAEPKCFGNNTGFIDLSTTGGTAPFSYIWQAHPDTNRIEHLVAGTYPVTITDVNNCSINTFFTINEPNEITVNFTSSEFCGGCNGEITANGTGGYPPFQYIWSSGSGQTVSDLCEGTYTVTIIDDSLCIQTQNYSITESGLSKISGILNYSGGSFADGDAKIELYKDSLNGASLLEFKDSVLTQTNGFFEFNDVLPESFYLRAVIKSTNTNYDNLYTSYYLDVDSTTLWTTATLLTLTCEDTIQNINFNMYEGTVLTGPGVFSGNIIYGDGISKSAGEPVPGAEVFVEQEPNDEPIANTETDTLGEWTIPNIPIGTGYKLYVDIPGLPLMSTYQNIEVAGAGSNVNELNFFVDTLTDGGIFTDTITSVIKVNSDFIEIKTFPNPTSNYLTIETNLRNKELVFYSIVDITGKELIISEEKEYQGKYLEQINITDLENGVFFLKLRIANAIYIRKIIKE